MKNSAEIAQSVEQWTENPRVDGSIPSLGTNENKRLAQIGLTFFNPQISQITRIIMIISARSSAG